MLETLFAHQSQGQAFLSLLVCGLALGLMLQLGGWLRPGHPVLSSLWDVATALLFGGMVLSVLLHYRTGLRAYAVLGILLGLLLHLAGAARLLDALHRWVQKVVDSRRPKAGESLPDGE